MPADYFDPVYEDTTDDSSVFSLDYYRNKAREFQTSMVAVDQAAIAARVALDAGISSEVNDDLGALLSEFESKKWTYRMTAEAINAGAEIINSMGGRFPQLSVPQGLGLVPFAIPAATIAAVGVAASLVVWGAQWVSGVNERLRLAQLLDVGTPDQKAELARAIGLADAAERAASGNPLSSIASVVKWIAIAGVGWMALQAFNTSSARR